MMRCSPIFVLCLLFVAMATSGIQAGTYRDTVLADSPVAYWTFDETDVNQPAVALGLLGEVGVAEGSYTDTGVDLGQPTLVAGEPDSSLRLFDNGRMTTEPFEKFEDVFGFGGTGYSVEFWTSLLQLPNGFTNFVGDGEAGGDFNLMVYTGAGSFVRPHNFTVDGLAAIDSVRTLKTDEIVHVISTWDSDTGETILYLDGQEADIAGGFGPNPNFGPAVNTDNRIYIGRDDREPRTPNGWLDEVSIYNYPLEPNQVLAHYNAGKGATPPEGPQLPPPPPGANISLSTDVTGKGTFGNGHSTKDGMVNIVRQIPNNVDANIVAYTADDDGPSVDLGEWIANGGTAGGFGSNEHGRGGNLWVPGDGEQNVRHEGFGGHANWMITFDLDEIRSQRLGDTTETLRLTGSYGSWGNIGSADPAAGVTQGLVFVDGQRVDNMDETTHNVPTAGGADSPSQSFDINIPAGAKHLSLALASGPDSTFWDDGVFRNVRLRIADPVLDAQEGLVSFWHFNEANSGTDPAKDQPGGNQGKFESTAERTVGIVGDGAAQFNNNGGDAVNVGSGDDNSFSFDTGLTVEAVFQSEWSGANFDYDEFFRKEDGGNRILLSFQNDPNNGGANPPVDPGPVLSFGLNIGGYGELDMPLDGVDGRPALEDIADGETHHVAATYDSESGEKAIWIDGEKLWSVELGEGSLISSGGSREATIGNVGPNAGEPFTGVIDEVALWSRALSAAEIAAHFQNVLAGGNYFGSVDPCDFDGDGSLSVADIDLLRDEVMSGTNAVNFDVNSDGAVNSDDIITFVTSTEKLNSYIGDSNLDGEFNSSDFVQIFQAGLYETGNPATWGQGDWNGDGVFNSTDLVFAFQGGGFELGPRGDNLAGVPEPNSSVLIVIGVLFAFRFRKNRR